MKLTSLFLVAAAVSTLFVAGCAPDTDSEEDMVLADEQALTGSSSDFKCQGNEDHFRPTSRGGTVKTVRAAAHPEAGYDRFVMELDRGGDASSFIIQRRAQPVFTDTGEQKYRAEGDDGLAVIFLAERGDHEAGGPSRIKVANGTGIREVVRYEDFEGNVEWGMGTKKQACFRTTVLTNPPRLVVDVKR